jgi:hypothetical protein
MKENCHRQTTLGNLKAICAQRFPDFLLADDLHKLVRDAAMVVKNASSQYQSKPSVVKQTLFWDRRSDDFPTITVF